VALLEDLVREFPKVPEYRHLLACCYRDTPPDRFGRRPPWRPPGDPAVALLRQLVADFPRVPDYWLDLCEALARPGPPSRSSNADKLARMKEAVELSKQLMAHYPNVPDHAAAHARYLDGLGIALFRNEQLTEAEEAHRQAVGIQTRLLEQYPQVVAYSFWLGLMDRSLGRVLGERGKLVEARTRLESATRRVESLWKKDARLKGARPFLGMAYYDLARVLSRSGESAKAKEALSRSQEFGGDRGPKGPPPHPR
jgi:tetratricopeptide (TPR) repeat protein